MPSDAMLAAVSVPTGGREFYTPEALAEELGTTVGALKTLRCRGGGPRSCGWGAEWRTPWWGCGCGPCKL